MKFSEIGQYPRKVGYFGKKLRNYFDISISGDKWKFSAKNWTILRKFRAIPRRNQIVLLENSNNLDRRIGPIFCGNSGIFRLVYSPYIQRWCLFQIDNFVEYRLSSVVNKHDPWIRIITEKMFRSQYCSRIFMNLPINFR